MARSTPKLRTATLRMRASMPWSRRASSMPAAMPSQCSASLEAGQPRVVDRRGQLDVDRAALRARGQVLVGDVAVVLAGADDARGQVVGVQEVQEVAPREAVGRGEDALGDLEPVALRRCGARGRASRCPRGGRAARPWELFVPKLDEGYDVVVDAGTGAVLAPLARGARIRGQRLRELPRRAPGRHAGRPGASGPRRSRPAATPTRPAWPASAARPPSATTPTPTRTTRTSSRRPTRARARSARPASSTSRTP